MTNFKVPHAVVWVKVNGDITTGLLTSNIALIPEDQRPTSRIPAQRGYKRLFCLVRQRWVSLYTKSITHLEVAQ